MAKRLVVCCDGTWNTPDSKIGTVPRTTNVTKLALSIASMDAEGTRQCTYYHPGVGTSRWEHIRGGAFGTGLSANVLDAYQFLIDNYEDGDELWFFGFSRGAYTARSVAGLVRNCGVLRQQNLDRMHEAYALYRSRAESPRGTASTLFRHAYSYEPRVRFIGVWDTVGALGIPVPTTRALQKVVASFNHRFAFHDTDLSTHVDGAFHALAIDEKRKAFVPTLWAQQPHAGNQVLEQVWFSGVHSDVGGGYAASGLSDIRPALDDGQGRQLRPARPPATDSLPGRPGRQPERERGGGGGAGPPGSRPRVTEELLPPVQAGVPADGPEPHRSRAAQLIGRDQAHEGPRRLPPRQPDDLPRRERRGHGRAGVTASAPAPGQSTGTSRVLVVIPTVCARPSR